MISLESSLNVVIIAGASGIGRSIVSGGASPVMLSLEFKLPKEPKNGE